MGKEDLPESIRKVIAAKCGSIVSLSLSWERSAAKALAAGASEETVVSLVAGMESARNLDALVRGTVGTPGGVDGFLANLRSLVDESAFDFASWLAAFEAVQRHLLKSGRSASSSSIVGYVQCSAEFGGGASSPDSLAGIIAEMLEQYGFEGQEGCGIGVAE